MDVEVRVGALHRLLPARRRPGECRRVLRVEAPPRSVYCVRAGPVDGLNVWISGYGLPSSSSSFSSRRRRRRRLVVVVVVVVVFTFIAPSSSWAPPTQ